ncbi:MAG: putative ABC transporter permease [Olsenella sp.]|nr:putative ABC transporter permease [Olsenella sp.]
MRDAIRDGSGKEEPFGVGLRLCQAYIFLMMGLALVFAFVCDREQFDYDLSLARVLVLMAGGTVALWLMSCRARSSRVVGVLTVAFCTACAACDHFANGAFSAMATRVGGGPATLFVAFEYAGAAFFIAYLLLSPRARRVLSRPPEMEPGATEGHSWDVPMSERVRTWEFWRDLLIYFVVFSIVGHWAEMLFCNLILAGVFMGDYDPTNTMLWTQWLYPFSAEGAAAVAIVVFLHPLARRIKELFGGRTLPAVALSFVANAAVCTSIDFITGITTNQDYHLWDYRRMPFNFMGQVCLQNSMVYSVAATLIVWVVYPLMDTGLRRMPKGVANALAFGLLGMYLFLALLNFVELR